jgi:ketosteroid isomerase-like protein
MKTRFVVFVVLSLVVGIGLVGCSPAANEPAQAAAAVPVVEEQPVELPTEAPTAVPEPTVDPAAAVVSTMIERVNAEDYAGAAELVADDMMVYLIGMPPTGMEIYWGKDQFQTFLEECCTGQNFEWEVVPQRVEDGVVYTESKTWMDFTRQLGVAPNSWHELFEVKDGKITLYVSTITEEALANFKPVIFEAIPELAAAVQPPAETGETPVSEVNITITNHTCAYDGPKTFKEGELVVNVDVQDDRFEKYALSFFTLDEGKDLLDLMASTNNPGPPSWSDIVFLKELDPGESQTFESFIVDEGLLYMVCWGGPPDIAIGNAGPFVVQK